MIEFEPRKWVESPRECRWFRGGMAVRVRGAAMRSIRRSDDD